MDARLWTIHRKGDRDARLIGDGFSLFALIVPPIWAIWHGAWLTLAVIVLASGLAALVTPVAVSPVMYGVGLILAFDGAEIRRWELRLWGWRETGVVEARTEEGAEELWLLGRVA